MSEGARGGAILARMTDSDAPQGAIPPRADGGSGRPADADDAEGSLQGGTTNGAAVPAARPAAASSVVPMVAGRRQFARTTPVVVDRGRATFGFPSLGDRRQLGQIGLVVLMVAALGALLLARLSPPTTPGLASGGSPTPHGSASASPRTSPHVSVSPTLSPGPSASSPTRSPTPSPTRKPKTYTVKSGDTLSSIAARFHTTAKIIEQLNGIKSPFVIHPRQVLKVP